MSRLFLLSATAFLFTLYFSPSLERTGRKQTCSNRYLDPKCRQYNQVCCNGVCNSTCVGKYCRWDIQCGSRSSGHKCCLRHCRASCEGIACRSSSHCKDNSLKCCDQVCRKESCLGSACKTNYSPYRTCGVHRGKVLQCCSGKCEPTCKDKPCNVNLDCGGWGRRMKCCNGVCKKSCLGSKCYEHNDCQSRWLDCCGFFENKTCSRSCHNHACSLDEVNECGRQRNPRLFCCGDGTCRKTCLGSKCFTETFRHDCRAPRRLLYCCGIGQKRCRASCGHVRCEKKSDCGTSMYYCSRPDRYNVSTCRFTHITDIRIFHDVRMDRIDFN